MRKTQFCTWLNCSNWWQNVVYNGADLMTNISCRLNWKDIFSSAPRLVLISSSSLEPEKLQFVEPGGTCDPWSPEALVGENLKFTPLKRKLIWTKPPFLGSKCQNFQGASLDQWEIHHGLCQKRHTKRPQHSLVRSVMGTPAKQEPTLIQQSPFFPLSQTEA